MMQYYDLSDSPRTLHTESKGKNDQFMAQINAMEEERLELLDRVEDTPQNSIIVLCASRLIILSEANFSFKFQ